MKVLFYVLIFLAPYRVISITPEKLFTSGRNKTFYIEHEYKYDWFESYAKCARMDMSLLAVDSKVKWDDVVDMIHKNFGIGKKPILWMSGYAVTAKRQFTWMSTGEEFTFTAWVKNNPDNAANTEFCVQIYTANLEWNDNTCTKKFGFICEFKDNSCDKYCKGNEKPKYNINFYNYQKT